MRQRTLASAGGITAAAAFSCHAFRCLEAVPRNRSFSCPFRPCHCFSLGRAAFTRSASFNNSDTLTRAFFYSIAFLPPLQEKALAHTVYYGFAVRSDDVATDHAPYLELSRSQDLILPLVLIFTLIFILCNRRFRDRWTTIVVHG